MREVLTYHNYQTIADSVYSAGNIVLKFYVKLAYKIPNTDKRVSYYSECTYKNEDNYGDIPLVSIRRKIMSYISIENKREIDGIDKEFIMINMQDMYYVNSKFEEMYRILLQAYRYNSNNRLELDKVYNPVVFELYGKRLEMIPIVLNYESAQYRGVRITLHNCNNYSDITMDQFMGFKYALDNMDIYGYTLSILSYLGKPEIGTNNYSMINENNSPFK